MAARQRRANPGLAEAITLGVLASSDPAVDATSLREAIDIWQETGCRLEEAATRVVAARIDASIARIGADLAGQLLRDHGIDVESQRAAGPLGVLARSAPRVFIQTLGGFRVIRDGVPVPNISWKSKKTRDLLKILVARRRSTPRDQLMELLWPEVEPAVAGNRLSVLLSTVRDVLQPDPVEEGPLITTGGAVSLNRTQVSIDVEDFLTRATTALDAARTREPNATALLAAAVTAHTGDFLEDDPYQEWASAIAEQYRPPTLPCFGPWLPGCATPATPTQRCGTRCAYSTRTATTRRPISTSSGSCSTRVASVRPAGTTRATSTGWRRLTPCRARCRS